MNYFAIDPGKARCGYAQANDVKQLVVCGWIPPRDVAGLREMVSPPVKTFVEIPNQRGRRSKVKVETLIRLAYYAGAAAGAEAELVSVASWKGSADKGSYHTRVTSVLAITELDALYKGLRGIPDKKQHNVLDAVCLLMVCLKRMWI